MRKTLLAIAAAALMPSYLHAAEYTHKQFHAITQVANAYAQSSFCRNVGVDKTGTAKYLTSQFGKDYGFDAEKMVQLALLIVGNRAMTVELYFGGHEPSKKEVEDYCTETLRLFGPSGTEIPALVN